MDEKYSKLALMCILTIKLLLFTIITRQETQNTMMNF